MQIRRNLENTISKKSKIFIATAVVVLALAVFQLLGWGGNISVAFGYLPLPIVVPVQKATAFVKQIVTGAGKIRSIYVENAELKTKVKDLELKLATLNSVEAENQVLKNTLQFKESSPLNLVPCTVVARDPEGLTFTLLLSCGKDDGVEEGQAVVVGGYLVGKVIIANQNQSTARLLTSPSLAVDAKVLGRQVSGVVRGSFGSGLSLDLVPSTSGVVEGDLIASAGINEQIPPDLLIGSVSEIVRIPGSLFDQISLTSQVDMRDLRFVYIVKRD